MTSKTTGKDSKFSITGTGTVTNPTLGADARIKIGDTADAYEVTSATNTFASCHARCDLHRQQGRPGHGRHPLGVLRPRCRRGQDAVAGRRRERLPERGRRATNNAKGSTATLKGDFSVTNWPAGC